MAKTLKDAVASLQNDSDVMTVPGLLEHLCSTYPGGVTFSTSFSYEDQVITDLICQSNLDITVFTLDTGRLFPETYSTWSRTLETYGLQINTYYPDEEQLNDFVTTNGPNAFYESVALRKNCCHLRKVVPLKKALQGKSVWITGLRSQHSAGRSQLPSLEWDESNNIIKYHPILHWTDEEVKDYISRHQVPYNSLHDKGFVSIGCAPCTRAVREGEDFRAGRWWWEDASKKECGLHVHKTVSN